MCVCTLNAENQNFIRAFTEHVVYDVQIQLVKPDYIYDKEKLSE